MLHHLERLLRVEESFRRLKHGIDVRPMYHRKDERIRAHVFACVLALLLAVLQTPWRFPTKRNLWAYSGFAVVTHTSAEYAFRRVVSCGGGAHPLRGV